MSIMNTFSGKRFDPMNITAEDICTEDIAHALSLLCRGGGHLAHFYSVGQHSLNCAKEAKARGWSERLQLACLLHDASEAYISDIIRPVKVYLTNYLEIEEKIMGKIWEKYGLDDLSEEERRKWKAIDDDILAFELKALMSGARFQTLPTLSSSPDISNRDWKDVEQEFLETVKHLQYTIEKS